MQRSDEAACVIEMRHWRLFVQLLKTKLPSIQYRLNTDRVTILADL